MKTRMWAVALVTVALAATNAFAFTVRGTVKNGTTGAMVNTEVTVVNPSLGMEDVTSVETKDGRFEIPDLGNDAPIYLVRADYNGVSYNAQVPVTGQDQDVEITVYESTKSWDGVRISVPHLAVTRDGNALHVEQMYEISNDTSPPKTVSERRGAFKMFLPADMDSLNDCFVSTGEMPLRMTPLKTDKPDIFSIDYPIRPGVTRVSVAYSLPYAAGSYTMKAKFPLPVPHMMVFAVDSSMQVSSSREFVSQQAVHGMSAYALHDIPGDSEVTLTFAGGDPNFAGLNVDEHGHGGADMSGAPPRTFGAPDDSAKLAVFLMVMVMFVMTGIVAVALRDTHDPLTDPKVLRAHYSTLLSRLARLDDLNAANAIPSDAYRASREDLMGRLGALALLLHKKGGLKVHTDTAPEPKTKAQ